MVILTSIHITYLVMTGIVLLAMLCKKEIVLPCALGILFIGWQFSGNMIGAIQTLSNAIMYACIELLGILVVIALVVSMSRAMTALGADQLLVRPIMHMIHNRTTAFWAIGFSMLILSWLIWPSPAVALVGALLLPIAGRVGLPAIWAAVAMNLFGHGAGLSSDFFIQGAPDITATAAGIDTLSIMRASVPLWCVMFIVTITVSFLMMRQDLTTQDPIPLSCPDPTVVYPYRTFIIALLIPITFITDIVLMVRFNIVGSNATALVAGTALILMVVITIAQCGLGDALETVSDHLREGFVFSIRIFAPVIVIAGFFFLGSENFAHAVLGANATGLLNDIGIWLSERVPLCPASVALLEATVGAITGLDGSGFSGLPLCGSLAQTLAASASVDVSTLAALGQLSTVWVGGGTIIPWGCIPVAAICGVNASELAKKNLIPVVCGLVVTTFAAILLM